MTNEVLKKPWTYLIVDFITNFPLVAEKNTIILVVDNRLSKIVHFVATIEGIFVEELAKLFRDNMWKLYRLLGSIVLDREPQFNLGD